MKKIILNTLFILFIFSGIDDIFSQPTLQWKSIFHNGTASNYLADMCIGDSGNVYIAYQAEGYVLRKISPTGSLIWEREYSAGLGLISEPKFLRYDQNGFIFISGDDYGVETLKYDLNGNLTWLRRFDDGIGFNSIGGMVLDSVGNCYLGVGHSAGLFNTKHYSIVKYNTKGDTVWVQRIYGSQYYGQIGDIILDKENNVIVTGVSNDLLLHPNNSARTVKLNGKTGEVIWNNFYYKPLIWNSADGIALGCDKDNNIYVGATFQFSNGNTAYLLKYSSSGELIWTGEYSNANSLCTVRDMITDSLGNCYLTGYETNLGVSSTDFFTIKFDSTGVLKWNNTYGSRFDDIPDQIYLDKFNNVYVIGSEAEVIYGIPTRTEVHFAAVKYDINGNQKWVIKYYNDSLKYSLGNRICIDEYQNVILGGVSLEGRGNFPNREFDITVLKYSQINSIHNISNDVISNYNLSQNFPNPFNPKTNINFNLKKSENVILNIYDISGKKVETLVNKKLSQGDYKIEWNANQYSSGVYFYSLYIDGKLIDSKKMILMK
ncbi:MAG TPA: hypothetical protein DEP28_01090 [Bacteroidetes bacterium]|nr:hypothetical protein [Bacteroidota bacterium]